jgi:HEAT repeat protein
MPSNACLPGYLAFPMSRLDDLFSGDDQRALAALDAITADDRPELTRALAGGDAEARCWASAALAGLPGEEATHALLTAAADPDPMVRAAVLHALGRRRAVEAITALLFALADPSPHLTRIAGDALIQIGAPAVPALAEALDRETAPAVRIALARALALIADTRSIPALFRALDDESALVQHWAEQGLERMGVGQVYFKP